MFTMQKILSEFKIEGFHSIYSFEFGKDFYHTPEKHDFWEMVYVDKGEIIATSDSIGCTLSQNQVIFHEPNEIHSHISNHKVANNMLVISFTCKSSAMDFFKKKTFTLDKTTKTLLMLFAEEAKSALGKIPDDYNSKNDLDFSSAPFGSVQLLSCYLSEFLIKLSRAENELLSRLSYNESAREIAEATTIETIIRFFEENINKPLTLKELCGHFMLGKSQLSKIFKEYTNQSPMAYFAKIKTAEAKRLLRENNMTTCEIADFLGYSSIHTFSRAFKEQTGFSPTDDKNGIL